MVPPMVNIPDGKLQGKEWEIDNGENVFAFLGIPYAKPPVGDLRFKAPQSPEPWDGIRDATEDGSQCYGSEFMTTNIIGSEDCLYLNVFTKSLQPDELRPVMVFIHGGGFVGGSSASKVNNPHYLLTEDVVLVAMNYRLGMLGFLCLEDPSLDVPGNAGLKDQTMALLWVQKNIAYFGGDHRNVTIFGISAGGASVHYHVLSPTSAGLFHKGILQSGSVHNPWPYGTAKLKNVLEVSGILREDEQSAFEYVKSLPLEKLYELQNAYMKSIGSSLRVFGPVVEKPNPTAFIAQEPVEIIASGKYNQVPLIFGYCDKEGLLFFSDIIKEYMGNTVETTIEQDVALHLGLDINSAIFKELMKTFDAYYIASGMKNGKIELISDLLFTAGIISSAKLHAATSTCSIYIYKFTFQGKLNVFNMFLKGVDGSAATHGDDMGYLFKVQLIPGEYISLEEGSPEKLTVNRMVKMWTDFAKTSDPTPPESSVGITWEPMNATSDFYLDIGLDLVLDTEPEKERMPCWRRIEEIYMGHGVKISGSP